MLETVKATYNRYEVTQDAEGNDVKTKNILETRNSVVQYDFGANLEETVEKFGEEAVHYHAVSFFRINLQNFLRAKMAEVHEDGSPLSDDEIKQAVEEWKWPTGRTRGKSKVDRIREMLSKMSKEEKEALFADLDDEEEDSGVEEEEEE